MLTGNKFYTPTLSAKPLSGEVNYTDWGSTPSVGSSYLNTSGSVNLIRPTYQHKASDWSWDKYAHKNVPTNNPYKTIDNYNTALTSVGEVAPQRKGVGLGNALMTVLDLMQRPQYMVTNVLQDLTDDKKDSFADILKGSLEGVTGKRKSSVTDTFDNLGWENDASKKWYQGGNLARTVAGFAGDVLLDPTTYLSAGTLGLAKGVGAKSVKEGMEQTALKTLKGVGQAFETGTDAALKMSKSDVARGLIDILAKPGAGLSDELASRAAAQATIEKSIAKHGNQSDLVLRIAHTLGHVAQDTTPLIAERTLSLVDNVLDKGLGALNRDVVSKFSAPLRQELDNILRTALPDAQAQLSRSAGQIVNKKLGKEFSLTARLAKDDARSLTLARIGEIFNEGRRYALEPDEQQKLLKALFDKTGKAFDDDLMKVTMTRQEFDLMDTLIEAFGGRLGESSMADLYGATSKLANKTTAKSMDKIIGLTSEMTETLGNIKRLENGIEFANGLQRVFDATEKSFYLRYHNPFTNRIEPIIELTNAAKSETARKAWGMIMEVNPFKPAIDKVGDVFSGVAKKFNTEYISDYLGKADWDAYLAAQKWAKNTTSFTRKENAIPQSALRATSIFKSVPDFFSNSSIRNAASIYVERNNSPLSKAAWLYISGEGVETIADDVVREAYEAIVTTPHVKKLLDSFGYKPEYYDAVVKAGVQNTHFNTAIAQFDGTNKIDFSGSPNRVKISKEDIDAMDYISRATRGEVDAEALEGYARIYNNSTRGKVDPLSDPSAVKIFDDKGMLRGGSLSTADMGTSSATSAKTGAYMHRQNDSAIDAFFNNPTGEYEFDLANRVARRTMESERVALNKEFVQSLNDFMRNEPGFNKLISKDAKAGFQLVELMDGQVKLHVHPEIANQLNRVTSIFDKRSVQEAAVDEMFAWTSNALKTMQTKYNPSFILRNSVGEPLMNWIAGVTAESHFLAAKIMKEFDVDGGMFKIGNTTFAEIDGKTTKLFSEYTSERAPGQMARTLEFMSDSGSKVKYFDDPIDIGLEKSNIIGNSGAKVNYYDIGGRKMTAQEIMTEFYEVGLGWSGITKGNEARNMRGLLEQEMVQLSSQDGIKGLAKTINQKVGKPGDFVETWTRLSQYIDSLNKGMDIQGAATEVRKFHVDYKDLTKFEREKLRNILPYYTYMRKNTPMQFKLLLERQNKINIIGQLVDSSYEAVQRDNRGEPLDVPDYLREGLAIPISVDDNGNVRYLNWGIPVADVGRLKYSLKELFTENFTSMLSPMIKSPLELSMNKNIMYGSDLERYEGQTRDLFSNVEGSPQISTFADQLLQQLGVVNNVRGGISTAISTAQQGTGNPLVAGLEKFLVGGFMPERSQDDVALQQAYDHRDQLYAHIQRLRAQGVDVPQYTPSLQSSPWGATMTGTSDQLAENNKQGYLGVSTSQLFPKLLKLLSGQ